MNDDLNDLPGMLAVQLGVQSQTFPHTMDAKVWADEFCKLNANPDCETMIAWFANAIMAGYDTARQRDADFLEAAQKRIAELESMQVQMDLNRDDMLLHMCETSQYAAFVGHDGHKVGFYAADEIGRRLRRIAELERVLSDMAPHWHAMTKGRVWTADIAGQMASIKQRLDAALAEGK